MGQFFEELKRRNVLRVAIAYLAVSWLLIQIAETLFPIFGLSDALIRLVAILLFIGFPIILIFSWAYELTPEGLKLERDVDRSRSVVHHTGKKLDRAIIVVLTLAVGFFAVDKFVLDPARDAELQEQAVQRGRSEALTESFGGNSIAVLPFVNMSDDASNEYFSDGISEELLNLLSKIQRLRVISRSSSFSYRDKDIHIPTIAKQLNVSYVLEGSVRKYGNQVRITAQLIEARSDTHLWSETYNRKIDDLFAIQDEISAAIVESLRDKLNLDVSEAPRVTAAVTTEAHDAFLRGRYLIAQRTQASVGGAIREFEKAISLDPDYALAHAELAIANLLGYLDITDTESFIRAAPHVETAMALDPSLAEAHAAAGLLSWTEGDLQEALKHFESAIQISPNYAGAYIWMGNILEIFLGRYAEAFAMREMTVQLDPLSIPAIGNYVGELMRRGRLAEADREAEKLASMAPSLYAVYRSHRLSLGGKWANGALGGLDALRIDSGKRRTRYHLTIRFALIGLEEEALTIGDDTFPIVASILGKPEKAIAVAEARLARDSISPTTRDDLGLALASAGNYDRARPLLEESWQRYGGQIGGRGLYVNHAAALIAVRRAAGERDGVGNLLAAIRDHVRRLDETGISTADWSLSADYENGLATYFAGDEERGLALIARAAEDGYFIRPNEAYLQDLYEHPAFAPIRAGQEARQARERKRFLHVVCTDNPYEAVWQPAKGTCERFAAAGGN